MSGRALPFASALALATALLACAGGASQNPPGGGGGGGSSGGGSSSGGTTGCPASAPAAGQPCAPSGQACEYGHDPNLSCDTYTLCGSNGQWSVTLPAGGAPGCPTSAPGSGGCPASYGSVPLQKACKANGLECGYPQGRCACTTPVSGPPVVGGAAPVWVCEQPAAGCPEPRPLVGGACSVPPGVSCDYGGCTLPGGTTLQCAGGAWAVVPTACAN